METTGVPRVSSWLERRAAALGSPGQAWIAALPDLVAHLQERRALAVEEELSGGTSSWVARVRRADGTGAVLKVALPDATSEREVAVLLAAAGRGYARVLAAAPEHRAVVLEPLGPSLDAAGLTPEQQIATLCGTLRDAWQVPRGNVAPEAKAESLAELVTRLWGELDQPCSARVFNLALECARRRDRAAGRRPWRSAPGQRAAAGGRHVRLRRPRRLRRRPRLRPGGRTARLVSRTAGGRSRRAGRTLLPAPRRAHRDRPPRDRRVGLSGTRVQRAAHPGAGPARPRRAVPGDGGAAGHRPAVVSGQRSSGHHDVDARGRAVSAYVTSERSSADSGTCTAAAASSRQTPCAASAAGTPATSPITM